MAKYVHWPSLKLYLLAIFYLRTHQKKSSKKNGSTKELTFPHPTHVTQKLKTKTNSIYLPAVFTRCNYHKRMCCYFQESHSPSLLRHAAPQWTNGRNSSPTETHTRAVVFWNRIPSRARNEQTNEPTKRRHPQQKSSSLTPTIMDFVTEGFIIFHFALLNRTTVIVYRRRHAVVVVSSFDLKEKLLCILTDDAVCAFVGRCHRPSSCSD